MKPGSGKRGRTISAPEVTNVSRRGLWLLLDGRERFLACTRFPWFREAPMRAIFDVRRPFADHLHRSTKPRPDARPGLRRSRGSRAGYGLVGTTILPATISAWSESTRAFTASGISALLLSS